MAGRPTKEAPSASALPPALARLAGGAGETGEADVVSVTAPDLAALLDAACERLADPHAALRLPSLLVFRRYDAFTLAARAAGSPRAVLELLVKYAPLVFPGLACALSSVDAELRIAMTFPAHPRGLGLAVDEYLLATVLAHARALPSRAWLASSRPSSLEPIFAALGTREVELGARDTGFAITITNADAALAGGDPMLLATAEEMAGAALAAVPRRGAFARAVAAAVKKTLEGEGGTTPSADAVASALHMSTRTLQRRLDDEGARFSEVLDGVREALSRQLLEDRSLPLAEIAFRAGFSDLATFSRAFKRWSGLPPGAYRRRAAVR